MQDLIFAVNLILSPIRPVSINSKIVSHGIIVDTCMYNNTNYYLIMNLDYTYIHYVDKV